MESSKYLIGVYFKCKKSDTNFRYYKKIISFDTNNNTNNMDNNTVTNNMITEYINLYLDNFCKDNNYTSYKLYEYDVNTHTIENEQFMKTIYF